MWACTFYQLRNKQTQCFGGFNQQALSLSSGELGQMCWKKIKTEAGKEVKVEEWREKRNTESHYSLKSLWCGPLITPLPSFPPFCIHLLWLSSPFSFYYTPIAFYLTFRCLSPTFLMLRSIARWLLFIYGPALSVWVGLSNIHLSCATVMQSLIPSHMWGMRHELWSLLQPAGRTLLPVSMRGSREERTSKPTKNWLPFILIAASSLSFAAFSEYGAASACCHIFLNLTEY